jgi:hypothetical protein
MGGSCSSNRGSFSNFFGAVSPGFAPVSNQSLGFGSTSEGVNLISGSCQSSGGIFVFSGPWSSGSPKAILNWIWLSSFL